jgi:hypothetical protein
MPTIANILNATWTAVNAYDRVMSTASVRDVPHSWVIKTRPGGKIFLPFAGSFATQAFVCLAVGREGHAHGQFQTGASFMRLRSQRDRSPLARLRGFKDAAITSTRAYHPQTLTEYESAFAVAEFRYVFKSGLQPLRRAAARATHGQDPADRHATLGPHIASLGTRQRVVSRAPWLRCSGGCSEVGSHGRPTPAQPSFESC